VYEKSRNRRKTDDQILSSFEEPSVRWISPDQWIYEDSLEDLPPWEPISSSSSSSISHEKKPIIRGRQKVSVEVDEASNSWSQALEQLSSSEADGIELPLIVLDAPLLPAGSHSIAVTDKRLEQLYDEILMSGGRRFVATVGKNTDGVISNQPLPVVEADDEQHFFANNKISPYDNNDATLPTVAQMGCVLYLTDVSDGPDGVRVCEHSVQPVRVKIQQVLKRLDGRLYCRVNVVLDQEDDTTPKALEEEIYVRKCENSVTEIKHILAGLGANFMQTLQEWGVILSWFNHNNRRKKNLKNTISANQETKILPRHEQLVLDELDSIAQLQKELDEDVCFRADAFANLGAGPGAGVGSLWHLANSCWLSYLRARAATRARAVYTDLHDRLVDFLRASGRLPPEINNHNDAIIINDLQAKHPTDIAVNINELPRELQRDLLMLQSRISDEIEPIVLQHKAAQTLLDADSHSARCAAFLNLLHNEHKRLAARASLKSLFESERAGNTLVLDPLDYLRQDDHIHNDYDDDDDATGNSKDYWRFYL